MQSSGDIFSASSVLGDRICHIQKEANRLQSQVRPDQNASAELGWTDAILLAASDCCARAGAPFANHQMHDCGLSGAPVLQLDAVTAERNSLHEDLISHRDSKRTVDRQWRLERERCERLESELAFYQSHSAQALSDRDKVIALSKRPRRICCLSVHGVGKTAVSSKSCMLRLCWATASATKAQGAGVCADVHKIHVCGVRWQRLPHVYQNAAVTYVTVQAVWEAEELKGQLAKAEGDLRDARAALGAEADSRAEAERQLQQVRQQNDSLRVSTLTAR